MLSEYSAFAWQWEMATTTCWTRSARIGASRKRLAAPALTPFNADGDLAAVGDLKVDGAGAGNYYICAQAVHHSRFDAMHVALRHYRCDLNFVGDWSASDVRILSDDSILEAYQEVRRLSEKS